jgi:glutamate-ammonia-ligase adenylyltransferase
MDAAFTSIGFAEPTRAEENLKALEVRLPANLWGALPGLLAQSPDPDAALNYLERFSQAAPDELLRYISRHPPALHHLLVVFGFSRFLSETLIQEPELIRWLHRAGPQGSIERTKSPEDLQEEFARFEALAQGASPAEVLARFKRREYLRIMLRDVLDLATLAETTMELSDLADALLERALRICEQKLHNEYGTPQAVDAQGRKQSVRLCVISLGKLGARELNYNSDIDLMFLFRQDGETSGGTRGAITNAEFFVRLAQSLLKLITSGSREGPVYRVDLRLRPQGKEGDLAVSLPAALDYYTHRAREWELQMLIKARCSAGDAEVCREFLRSLHSRIYPRGGTLESATVSAIEAVLNARQEITRELRRRAGGAEHPAEWNVKLSPGGIRDIEFLTQCLQRVYGGRDPWLAGPSAASTLVALQRLHDKGYLSGRDFFRLGTAYQFLRRVEHRLQLRDGLQRHTLPESDAALERLARRCGIEPSPGRSLREQLLNRIRQHFSEVREIYERHLRTSESPPRGEESPSTIESGESALLHRLRREYPQVAQAAHTVFSSGSTLERRGLQRFLNSAVLEPESMAKIEARPEWLARAAAACARSELVAEILARHPDEITAFGETEAPPAGEFDGTSRIASAGEPADWRRNEVGIRMWFRRHQFQHILAAVEGRVQPFDTFSALTRITESALNQVLDLAAAETGVARVDWQSAPLAVLALGRLGTSEVDVASDGDLVFITDNSLTIEQREPWRKLVERFIHLVSSHTREGILLPVDTRLRPRGHEGEMLQPVESLRDYCRTEAQGWEAIAWLKARPVAGNLQLGTEAIESAQGALRERFRSPQELAASLVQTRKRLETESTGARAKGEFKKLSGGYYDIEYVLGFLFLSKGARPVAAQVMRQIAALESAGALDTASAMPFAWSQGGLRIACRNPLWPSASVRC